MPSLTAYTPYETLAIFQSVARHGTDQAAFEEISVALNANELVRENSNYDAKRFTADALQGLYDDLLKAESAARSAEVNGSAPESSNPRKRKLSPPPAPNGEVTPPGQDDVQKIVDKLYAQFRQEVIKEIQADEAEYNSLQKEIKDLERQVESQQHNVENGSQTASVIRDRPSTSQSDASSIAASLPERDVNSTQKSRTDVAKSSLEESTSPSPSQKDPRSTPDATGTPHPPVLLSQHSPPPDGAERKPKDSSRSSQPPPLQHSSPGTFNRTLPTPSPQRPSYGSLPSQHAYTQGSQVQSPPVFNHMPGVQPLARSAEHQGQKRPSSSTPGRGSPMPIPHPSQYIGYPPYQQPPPWPHQMQQHYPYPQHGPLPNQQFYVPPHGGRPISAYQTPHHSPYQHYPQTAPIHYQAQPPHGWHGPPGHPYYSHPASVNTTPMPRPPSQKAATPASGSSTPWKKRPDLLRFPSPTRPERDVSPLSDVEPVSTGHRLQSSPNKSASQSQKDEDRNSLLTTKPLRRDRVASVTPRPGQSRSQSRTPVTSEIHSEKQTHTRRAHHIKAEPSSTPAPIPPETDQAPRPTARRGRPRNNTLTSVSDLQRVNTVSKRKRSLEQEGSAASPLPSPTHKTRRPQPSQDPNLVLVSKSFAKTAHLLLNEITSHKLGGIFAKPLSERDAPGYLDLVTRPQDLKSIKTAVSKGNRAAMAAMETFETEQDEGDNTPAKSTSRSKLRAGEGPLGNGMYLVKKTEDLIPPRGIVNSSQMEVELLRIFANAVMFNPLPSSERGFGRSLRLRKHGGDVQASDEIETEASDDGSSEDERGIISDAREMFEDVMEQVKKWRELEGERTGGETGRHGSISISIRHSSVSSAINEDDGALANSTNNDQDAATTTGRKRRKIAAD